MQPEYWERKNGRTAGSDAWLMPDMVILVREDLSQRGGIAQLAQDKYYGRSEQATDRQ
jgi:hypothetical protein